MAEFERTCRFDPDEHIAERTSGEYQIRRFALGGCVLRLSRTRRQQRPEESGTSWSTIAGAWSTQLAWIAFASRGKKLNLAWSLGSVRYDASPETAAEIRARAGTEAFDPNLFPSRDEAVGGSADAAGRLSGSRGGEAGAGRWPRLVAQSPDSRPGSAGPAPRR
ncbi:MAG: hypothetical protein R3E48_16510 [Burkholderiaceae bacterium]